MKLTRSFASSVILLMILFGFSNVYSEPYRFISMADSRGAYNGVNDPVLSNIVDFILLEDAEFVLFSGDLVNGSSTDSILTSQLYHWRDVMAPIYASNMYGAKIYAIPGNHEIQYLGSGEEVWQTIFNDLPSNGPAGETYMTYSFDYANAHFVMLDTNRYANWSTLNYNWLANDLASTTADHIFVFGHEPAYPAGPRIGSSLDYYPDQRDAFWQLLVDYDVDIYFTGHEHLYNHINVDGVHQIINGTSGAGIYWGYGGDFFHYALITVDGPSVSIDIIDDSGTIRDNFDLKKVSFGLIADVHYNVLEQSYKLINITNAVDTWNSRGNLSFVVELGDFIREIDATTDIESQAVGEAELQNFNGNVYGAIGNHDHSNLTADDYANTSSIMPARYYSFDTNGIHFIVLHGTNQPFFHVDSAQLIWLENDLASSSLPTVVFSHIRFDQDYPGVNQRTGNPYCVAGSIPHVDCLSAFAYNSDEVRDIFEDDGNVLAVFSGHTHTTLNARSAVNGIQYFAMTSGESHAIVNVSSSNNITVEGFGSQLSYAADIDADGILDDGDSSGTLGDTPCTGGSTVNCDDNCLREYNPDQSDADSDGVGDVCEIDCLISPVRIASNYYMSLKDAYDDAGNGDTIQSHATVLSDDLDINLNKSVTLQGGYWEVSGLHSSDYPLLPVQGLHNDTLPTEIIIETIK